MVRRESFWRELLVEVKMGRFSSMLLVVIVAGVATAALGCPSQQYFSDQYSNGGTTATSSSSASTGGGAPNVPCSSTLPCEDDNNPCTTEACTNGFCIHTPLNVAMGPESTECVTIACVNGASTLPVKHPNADCGTGLKCNADGQCADCKDKSACPAPPDCQIVSCVATVCQVEPAPAGDPSVKVMDTLNDCKKPVCNGKGGIEFVADGADLPILDKNPCTDQACVGDAPMYPASGMGTACTSASPAAKVCDGNGACVECAASSDCTTPGMLLPSCDLPTHTCISCSDGKLNGTETGVDCGGNTCTKCNGDVCGLGTECKSNVCADGACCNMACSGKCLACDVPSKAGTCSPISKGLDPSGCGGDSSACDGAGMCASVIMGDKAGKLCSQGADCYTGACNGMCRLPNFAPCSENTECASLWCVANVCTACSANADCASNKCNVGRCLIPGSGVCKSNGDCAGGTCDNTTNLCGKSGGGTCANGSDCATHHCSAMGKCAACNMATQVTDCTSQMCDSNGNCFLPSDAPCTGDVQCASSMCSKTFPAKCQ